jgi:hypothetical protein
MRAQFLFVDAIPQVPMLDVVNIAYVGLMLFKLSHLLNCYRIAFCFLYYSKSMVPFGC